LLSVQLVIGDCALDMVPLHGKTVGLLYV